MRDLAKTWAAIAAFVASVAAPIAWSIAAGPEPEFLAGAAPGDLRIQSTEPIAATTELMAEGIFRQIEYLYEVSFSPDGDWLAMVIDAIPDRERQHRYYVYLLRRDGSERKLMLVTKVGPGLGRSFAWLGRNTPLFCAPQYDADLDFEPDDPGPTGAAVQLGGFDPVVSPDGRRAAFRRGDELEASLWLIDLSPGAQPTQLADTVSTFVDMRWSPDGTRLAYLAPNLDIGGETLWVIGPDQRPEEMLPLPLNSFTWSPDGRAIAALSDTSDLVLAPLEGRARIVARSARDMAWGPDGKALAYIAGLSTGTGEAASIWNADSNESHEALRSRSTEAWDLGTLHFSLDGQRLYVRGAAGRDVNGDGQYYDRADRVLFTTAVAPGSEPTEVPIRGAVQEPATARGGRLMAFTVEGPDGSSLWCVDTLTAEAAYLGSLPVQKYAYALTWSPDGAALAFEDFGSLMLTQLMR